MTGALYPAITSKDLRKVLIPFPPVEVQKQISNHINSLKVKIKELNILSAVNRESALVAFEKKIFN
jgi:restriction endonuclease S subunit